MLRNHHILTFVTFLSLELQSPLHIGSIPGDRIEFSGDSARQYISYLNDARTVKFVGEKEKLKISNLYKAFAISERNSFLKKAIFAGQVIVAYNSENEGNFLNLSSFCLILFSSSAFHVNVCFLFMHPMLYCHIYTYILYLILYYILQHIVHIGA